MSLVYFDLLQKSKKQGGISLHLEKVPRDKRNSKGVVRPLGWGVRVGNALLPKTPKLNKNEMFQPNNKDFQLP